MGPISRKFPPLKLTMYILCDNILSKPIGWDEEKNALLKKRRRISFEDIVRALAESGPLWIRDHPRPDKYPGQRLLGALIAGYVYIVPYEETDEKIIFKTAFPSRRATRAPYGIGAKKKGQGPP
jgi:uncharacterized DUF497 family protein